MSNHHKKNLKDERVLEFASCELLLDILYTATTTYKLDLEAIWIVCCVLHNTMRIIITDADAAENYLGAPEVPENLLLSMSRRAIADKTGLSRETVRRRTNKLLDDGILEAEPNGNVKISQTFALRDLKALNQIFQSVGAFNKRLHDHKVRMPLD
ncbi:MAG: helix-turn-helix domain-containing protein [Caulobacterales bacterium]